MQSLIRKSILFVSLAFALGTLSAQNPAPPSQRIPASLPTRVTWSIEYSSDAKPQPAQTQAGTTAPPSPKESSTPTLLRQEISRTPKIRVEKMLWNDQRQTENWIIGDEAYFQPEGSQDFVSGWLDFDGQRRDRDFPDLEWVNRSNFAGTETKNGVAAYVYKWNPAPPSQPDAPAKSEMESHSSMMQRASKEAQLQAQGLPTSPTTVWIDQKTLWPIAVESNGMARKYSYKMEVAEPLVPPQAVQALVNERKAYLEEARGAKMTRPD